MGYKVGNYIHATYVSNEGGVEAVVTVQGKISEILDNGILLLSDGHVVNPDVHTVTVFENVTHFESPEQLARAEAMRRHPAGKGLKI